MTTINRLHQYINGNYSVELFSDGTKVRSFSTLPKPLFPESIDLKITDYCNAGCAYCHENSTIRGKHSEFKSIMSLCSSIPAGVEIAIGGGNPLDFPYLKNMLIGLKDMGLIANLTVNQKHLSGVREIISNNICYGIGISCINTKKMPFICHENIVIHLIIGIHGVDDLAILFRKGYRKFLLLGYKNFRRGARYLSIKNEIILPIIDGWKKNIAEIIGIGATISFDNLAIEQLALKDVLSQDDWQSFYMGDDGKFTMYVDMVKEEFAISSTSHIRHKVNDQNIFQMFSRILSAPENNPGAGTK